MDVIESLGMLDLQISPLIPSYYFPNTQESLIPSSGYLATTSFSNNWLRCRSNSLPTTHTHTFSQVRTSQLQISSSTMLHHRYTCLMNAPIITSLSPVNTRNYKPALSQSGPVKDTETLTPGTCGGIRMASSWKLWNRMGFYKEIIVWSLVHAISGRCVERIYKRNK